MPQREGGPAPEGVGAGTRQIHHIGHQTDTDEYTGRADILDYLRAVFGAGDGWAHTALGSRPYLEGGKYRHRKWAERAVRWPDDAETLAAALTTAATTGDVYVCPYLMRGQVRAKGAAVARRLVHTDVDSAVAADRVRALGGFAVASGTPGHAHIYVPVDDDLMTLTEHQALCRALCAHFGGDPGKISDNDFLRPAGTLSHKTALAGGEPTPVDWLVRP